MYKTILPASGLATRIGGTPKYLLPIQNRTLIHLMLEKLKKLNSLIFVPTLPKYVPLVYEHISNDNVFTLGLKTKTMSETLSKFSNICSDATTIFAMPDTYFEENCFQEMLSILENNDIDVCLGLWKITEEQRGKLGQCKFDKNFILQDIIDKTPSCPYHWAWGIACWKPILWKYLDPETPHIGYAFSIALKAGLKIYCHTIQGRYYDCGTMNEYKELLIR